MMTAVRYGGRYDIGMMAKGSRDALRYGKTCGLYVCGLRMRMGRRAGCSQSLFGVARFELYFANTARDPLLMPLNGEA